MDEVVPTSALSPAQSPTQSPDEMQLAITLRDYYDGGTGPYNHWLAGGWTPRHELPTAVKACKVAPTLPW